jgi:hypothetical protein
MPENIYNSTWQFDPRFYPKSSFLEIIDPGFFHQKSPSDHLIHTLKLFRICFRIRREIRIWSSYRAFWEYARSVFSSWSKIRIWWRLGLGPTVHPHSIFWNKCPQTAEERNMNLCFFVKFPYLKQCTVTSMIARKGTSSSMWSETGHFCRLSMQNKTGRIHAKCKMTQNYNIAANSEPKLKRF